MGEKNTARLRADSVEEPPYSFCELFHHQFVSAAVIITVQLITVRILTAELPEHLQKALYKSFILMLLSLELHWQWNLINPGKYSTFPKTNKQKINSKMKSLRIVRATMNLLMKQTSLD